MSWSWDGRRVALVGGAGLIGSHVVDQLLALPVAEVRVLDNFVRGRRENLAHDPRVRVVEGSMADRSAVRRAIEGVSGVFHLASPWLGECLARPREAWETNVFGTLNVVEVCRECGVERLVYSSSASVYGDAVLTPMNELHPFNNRTTYGATKIACEQMLRAFYEQHGLPYVALRYMNVYGPRMDRLGAYVAVVMRVLDRILAGDPPVIFGDGSQVYDFVYVEDVARANVLAMQCTEVDEAINVGTGRGTSIAELVRLLLDVCDSRLEPVFEPGQQSFVRRRIGSTDKALALLGFEAKTSLRRGLERLVAWRRSQA